MEQMSIGSMISIFLSIFLVNIVLSGDNAILIAMASRKLNFKERALAMFWGSTGAIVLLILFTFIAVLLLKIPFLSFIGGSLMVWIAIKLLTQNDENAEDTKCSSNLLDAIKYIIIADLLTSTDNVLAIAGISKGNYFLLALGLATSIPLIILGAQFIALLMKRFPIIVYAGGSILGWTGGKMIIEDKRFIGLFDKFFSDNTLSLIDWLIPAVFTCLVLVYGYWINQSKVKKKF